MGRRPMNGRWFPLFLSLFLSVATARAAESRGSLLLIGGGLRRENREIYRRLIELAGGPERAVIGIVPTASLDTSSEVAEDLVRYGLPRERVILIDTMEANAASSANDPAVVA